MVRDIAVRWRRGFDSHGLQVQPYADEIASQLIHSLYQRTL